MSAAPSTLSEVVTTERLVLRLIDAEEAADIVAGRRRSGWHVDFPREDDRDAMSLHRAGDPWSSRLIQRGTTVLGSIGFFGPPEGGGDEPPGQPEAEVGYGLVAQARGWGFATEALRGLLAETDRAGVRVRASVQPANRAGIRVLAKCGFTDLRGSDDEGHLVMARPLPHAPSRPVSRA